MMDIVIISRRLTWILLLISSAGAKPALAEGTFEFAYGGRLVESNGKPVDGPVALKVSFFHDSFGKNEILSINDGLQSVALQQGVFQFRLALPASDYDKVFNSVDQPVWIQITDLTHPQKAPFPLQQIMMTPYAAKVPVDGSTVSFNSEGKLTVGPSGAPGVNQFVTKDSSGNFIWATPAASASALQGQAISAAAPAAGQVLQFNGSQWLPATFTSSGGTLTSLSASPPLALTGSATAPSLSVTQATSISGGYVSSADWLTFNAKQAALGYSPVNKAGDSMTGSLNMGAQSLTNLATPSAASDAATKSYVDTTALRKDGTSALTANWAVGGKDLTGLGNVGISATKTLTLGIFTNSTEATLTGAFDSSGATSPDKGKTWFNSQTNQVKYWDGSTAQSLGVSGAGLTSLNGQSGSSQTFLVTQTGNLPAMNSNLNVHTLSIPLANAGASVSAGLISNVDYLAFSGKQASGSYLTALTGDISASGPGSSVATLNATGVAAGTYAKVTVDAKGRVTAASSLGATDIPNLSAAQITSGTLATSVGGTGVNSSATFPTTGVVVTEADTETLTNKTLTAPVISSISNTGILTLPTSSDTLVGRATSDTLTNKTLTAATINGASSIGGSTTIATSGTISAGATTVAGNVTIQGNATNANKLVLNDKGSANALSLKAPDTLTGSVIWTLPGTDGTSGQLLSTSGTGTLSWASGAAPTGSAGGDLAGSFPSPTVSTVGTSSAANVHAAELLANAAASANTASAIVKRDASGNFTAGTITAALSGNATTATSATNATTAGSFTGSLVGDVTGTQGATVVANVGAVTAANVATGANLANAGTNANTASALVRRDASGNFTAGTITAALTGNASTATSAGSFTGALVGDVTGTQGATVVATVGTSTAANIHTAEALANAAASANSALAIVKRDSFGAFSSGQITASTPNASAQGLIVKGSASQTANLMEWQNSGGTALSAIDASGYLKLKDNDGTDNYLSLRANPTMSANLTYTFPGSASAGSYLTTDASGTLSWGTPSVSGFTGSLSGDVTGTQGSTVVANVGGVTSANVATGANLANAGTNANTASTLVKRDASGNFTAGTITAALTGNVTGNVSGSAANVTGIVAPANGGSGIANNAASTFTLSGNFPLTTTLTAATSVTLPTSGTLATLAGTETLTGKTLTAPVISSIVNTGTLTLPTATDTLVGRTTTDTLTNKTLTTPIISSISNTGTLTLPTSTDTLVGRATTDTLTNKTLTNPTITGATLTATTLTTTGNVGIGTTTTSGGALSVMGGNVGIGTTSPNNTLQITGTLGFGTDSGRNWSLTGNTGTNAGRGVDGNAGFFYGKDGSNNRAGVLLGQSSGTYGFVQSGTQAAGGTWSNQALILQNEGGNVGVGTTTPALRLDLAGIAGAPATSGTAQTGIARFETYPTSGLVNVLDMGAYNFSPFGLWFQGSNSTNLNPAAYTYPLIFQPNGGNVGIGSISPGQKLSVAGTIESTSGSIKFPDATTQTTAAVTDLWSTSSGNVYRSSGNVGIGTTAPAVKLQVAGQVAAGFLVANSTTINWQSGNIQSTNVAAGTLTMTTGSMIDGASYTLILNNATGGNYILTSADITTWKCLPACSSATIQVAPGKDTVATFIKAGPTVYVSWLQGF